MDILIHLGSRLVAEGIRELLVRHGYRAIMAGEDHRPEGVAPHIVLADSTTIDRGLLREFPASKILMIDTGLDKEKAAGILLTYRIHGVLYAFTEIDLFKRALDVVQEGRLWIDHDTVKILLGRGSSGSRAARPPTGISEKERRVIALVNRGLSNKEIAGELCVSPHTVKAHLRRIFQKLNVAGRTGLRRLDGGNAKDGARLSPKLLRHKIAASPVITDSNGSPPVPELRQSLLPVDRPNHLPQVERTTPPVAARSMARRRGRHVLVVDDQQEVVAVTAAMLEQLGYSAHGETASARALREFSDRPELFDLAILDHVMPDMTGVELAERFTRIRRGFPVLLYTGYPDSIAAEQVAAAGIERVLTKPLTMEQLGGALREAVR